MINQMYHEKLNNLNARYRYQRDLKYAVSEFATRKLNKRQHEHDQEQE